MTTEIAVALLVAVILFASLAMVGLAATLIYTGRRLGPVERIFVTVAEMRTDLDSVIRSQKRMGVQASKDKWKPQDPPGPGGGTEDEIAAIFRGFPTS